MITNLKKKNGIGLIHKVYLTLLKQKRKFTAFTKTKSEVRGGGRKPWRQKGTGNARAGSTRSPLWVGGGVSFGPRPHTVTKKINKREKKIALSLAFQLKKQHCFYISEDSFDIPEKKKTKHICSLLKTLNLSTDKKILFLVPEEIKEKKEKFYQFWLASRNLKNIEVSSLKNFHLLQLLNVEKIVLSKK
jgi:large subunit ribosomal protein L4